MKKAVFFVACIISGACACYAQTTNETITLTTYYPSPNGVYRYLRLFPAGEPSSAETREGTMFYDRDSQTLKYRNNETWINLTDSGGYWQKSGADIKNTNGGNVNLTGNLLASGSINATGDVCTASGTCLSTGSMTIVSGYNTACPTGQTMLMKAYSGTWYTADNSAITTWTKAMCGKDTTLDGTSLLVNNVHTQGQCTSAGGVVVSNMCRFGTAARPVTACPTGWTETGYSATTASSAAGTPKCGGTFSTSSHVWSASMTIECACTRWCCSGGNSCANTCVESPSNGVYGTSYSHSCSSCTTNRPSSCYDGPWADVAFASRIMIGCY